jgi:hypothetical protein
MLSSAFFRPARLDLARKSTDLSWKGYDLEVACWLEVAQDRKPKVGEGFSSLHLYSPSHEARMSHFVHAARKVDVCSLFLLVR